ncbi:hydroxymethylglutaryl-CoA lyase [Sphingobium ummariense]
MQAVEIVEVGMRDGFQSVPTVIPTGTKIALMEGLYAAGIRRFEATSFVSPSAVPQLADAAEIINAASRFAGLDAQALVPTARQADRALAAGVRHLAFVFSVSPAHNQSNVRRTPAESIAELEDIVSGLSADICLRINVATAFDCPYLGRTSVDDAFRCLDEVFKFAPEAEIALCDTTGRVAPDQVSHVFTRAQERYAGKSWAFHAHDTYGFGIANTYAAWQNGVRIFDASIAGLGGCPFAPGATGNVATEDVMWLFESMGVRTGIDIDPLLLIAHEIQALPDAVTGGRIRNAMAARRRINAA